jgi:hypothetical protein
VLAIGSLTGLTNTFDAKYTWCRKERQTVVYESNPSNAASAGLALSNESLKITVATPPDGQINCIRFYRADAGAATTFSYIADLNYCNQSAYACTQDWEDDDDYITGTPYRFTTPNTTDNTEDCFSWEIYRKQYAGSDDTRTMTGVAENVLFIDNNTAEGSEGTEIATDHDQPPLGSYVAGPSFNGTLFIIKDNKLYFSLPKQPEYWPSSYYVDVSSIQYGGVCMVFHDKQPFYLTKNKIYYIAGTTAATFLPQEIAAKTGTQSQNGAVAIEGIGIAHVGSDGVYICQPSTDSKHGSDTKITGNLDPIFRGETKNGVAAVGDLSKSWLVHWEDKLYFGYPGSGDTYPTNILVFYVQEKRIAYHTRGQEIHAVTVDNYNNRLLAVDDSGYAWEIESKDVTTDDGTAISWEVQSKDFTLQTRRHFPRWAKYDVNAASAVSATGEVLLDDVSHQSHTLSGNRITKRRLIATGNGRRVSHKISGSGPIEIYAVESE